MAHERSNVRTNTLSLNQGKVIIKRFETPIDTGAHGFERHPFHPHQVLHRQFPVSGMTWRNSKATVSDQGSRYTMLW